MIVSISHVSDGTFFRTLVHQPRAGLSPPTSGYAGFCATLSRTIDRDTVACRGSRRRPEPKRRRHPSVNFSSGFLSAGLSRRAEKAIEPEMNKAVQALKDQAQADGKPVPYAAIEKLQRQYGDRIPRPPFSVLIDHIDHIAKVAGVDHVGIGSDFDGSAASSPRGSTRPPICPKSPRRWMARGYSAEDCRKILGGKPTARLPRGPSRSPGSCKPRTGQESVKNSPFDRGAKVREKINRTTLNTSKTHGPRLYRCRRLRPWKI